MFNKLAKFVIKCQNYRFSQQFTRVVLQHKRMSSKDSKDEKEADASSSSESTSSTTGLTVEALRRYLAVKLGFLDEDEVKEKVKVLDDVSIDGIVEYMMSDKCKRIITMAGAGISTSAGIPDFRSPGSGLYHNLEKYQLPDPQSIFELSFFRINPKPFFVLAKELYPGSFKPTVCHYFIKLLNEKGKLTRHYTQNIDTLERVAKIPGEKLVEAHGTFHTGHCLECRKEYTLEWMKEKIFRDEIPTCEACTGIVKPDIVFFGENLPDKFHTCILDDFNQCDLLIILGSSLVVQPFASLIDKVPDTCPRLLINREKAGHCSGIMSFMGLGGGMDYDGVNNTRDVAWLGDCDEGCQLLADKLGWGDELRKLFDKEHAAIDKEAVTNNKIEAEASDGKVVQEKLETKTEAGTKPDDIEPKSEKDTAETKGNDESKNAEKFSSAGGKNNT